MGHARLSPSNHRWPLCPGSVGQEANYPDVAGQAAIDGTGSHLLLEMCLDNHVPAIQYDGQIIGANHPDNRNGWLVSLDRIERVQCCLDYVTRRVRELKEQYPNSKTIIESESKSDPGKHFGRDDWYGTCDITITCVDDGKAVFLEVVDYKDGRGWVNVKYNTQLVSYLFGKMRLFDKVKECRMTIVQPKTNPMVRYHDITPEEVLAKAVELNQAAIRTDDPNAPTISGKHCQWCKANPKRGGHCVTATEKSIKVLEMSTELINPNIPAFEQMSKVVADPRSLTSEQLAEIMSAKEALLAAFDKCEAEITQRIESGQQVLGYSLEPGRATRKWVGTDELTTEKLKAHGLELDDIYQKKISSPAQVLKSDKLTKEQKQTIESELVVELAGKIKLKKVAHNVAQCSTSVLSSKYDEMFKDVPTISFL